MSAPTVYLSSDAGAPAFDVNAGGSLAALLDAVLVNGYGSKAPLGWTKPFASGNTHVYRAGGTGLRHYLRYNGTNAFTANIRAYATMSDADTGTDPYPSLGQVGGNGFNIAMASNTGNASCPWAIVGNEYYFDLYISGVGSGTATGASMVSGYQVNAADATLMQFQFGRFTSYVPGDGYNYMIQGKAASGQRLSGSTLHQTSYSELYLAANPQGTVVSVAAGRHFMGTGQVMGGAGGYPYVDPHTGELRLQSKVRLLESNLSSILWRGEIPGLAFPLSDIRSVGASYITGSGALAGKTYFAMPKGDTALVGYHCYDMDDWGN